MNATSGEVLWRSTPLEKEHGVGGLTFDGQGRLFGMTYGTVFELNPADGTLLRSVVQFPYTWETVTNFQPRAANMAYDPGDGYIYATNGSTRRIDPDTLVDTGPNYKAGFASLAPGPSKFYIQNGALLEVLWY